MITIDEKIVGMFGILLFLSFINAFAYYFNSEVTKEKDTKISDPIDVYINKITKRYELEMQEQNGVQTTNEIEKCDEKKDEQTKQIVNEQNFMFEYTPLGYVIMKYNNEINSFEYYANRSLPYRLLEALSKKFVMLFGCKTLYKHMKHKVKKIETQHKTQHKSYAKLKPIQKEKIEKTMNTYHFKGKTNEFIFLQPSNISNAKENIDKPLTYSDFKRKNCKK